MVDAPTPLCTEQQFMSSRLADLATNLTAEALNDALLEGTRRCEGEIDRRLAPFTNITESHRATGIDPDEYTDAANLPLDLLGVLGRSYAYALGASSLVRAIWLHEYAPRYAEMWSYTVSQIKIVRSYGGSELVNLTNLVGPDPDSGFIWFQLGTFLPIASRLYVTYSGGYQTIPGDLVRAGRWMTASIIARELDPVMAAQHGHDPDALEALAVTALDAYERA